MRSMKFIFLFVFGVLFSIVGFAQGTFNGCIYNNVVYTTVSSGTRYNSNGTSPKTLSFDYCSWTPTTGTSCTICIGGNGMWSGANCSGGGKVIRTGLRNTFTMVICPLDDYTFILCSLIGLVAITQIKKKVAAT